MELVLHRSYFKEGVNGTLFTPKGFLCHTIELPWQKNQRNISCIPEGKYELQPRFSKKFNNHLILKDVPKRSLILLHPANNALEELRGCIAPVTYLGGVGKGIYSKDALDKLLSLVHQALDRKEEILLTIKSTNHETYKTISRTNAQILQKPSQHRHCIGCSWGRNNCRAGCIACGGGNGSGLPNCCRKCGHCSESGGGEG